MSIGLLPAICLLATVSLLFHYTHMFQLNSYMAVRQMRWLKKNLGGDFLPKVITTLIMLAVWVVFRLLPMDGVFSSIIYYALTVMAAILFVLWMPLFKKQKKPLVFTKRVTRLLVSQAIITALVFTVVKAIFSPEIAGFAVMLAAFFTVILAGWVNAPIEKSIQQSFIDKAKKKLGSMPNLTVIGITGSYGKTGVKHYLAKILSSKYNVLMTPGSYNTTMGVVRTINEMLTPAHEIFICEMGAKGKGQIKEICDIVHPRYGILTSIGPQHLENFKTIENIIDTKFELIDALPDDGIAFLNFDNKYIRERDVANVSVVSYGENGDFRYADPCLSSGGTDFNVEYDGDKVLHLSTKLAGRHNMVNITGCVAVAVKLGLSAADIMLPVKRLECAEHRLQIRPMGDGSIILDDAFNANPDGVKAALEVLGSFEGMKKIMITPGMIELGAVQHEENMKFGKAASGVCDRVLLVGESVSASVAEGLEKAGYPAEKLSKHRSFTEAFAMAKSIYPDEKKVILIENDLPDNYK